MNNGGEGDHAKADGPDHLQIEYGIGGIEGPAKGDDEHFQQDQPDAAGQQEEGKLAFCLPIPIQACRDAGEENECRRAIVRDKTGEEQKAVGLVEIRGIVQEGVPVKIVADMVDGHDDHDYAAQKIDGFDASFYG